MLDRLEDRLLLSADGSFPPAVDTNQDGLFQPYDALILLNAVSNDTSVDDAPQLDLNGDGQLSTADVDLIIGSLNSYYGGDWDAESIAALDDVTLAISDTVVSEGAAADVTVSLVQPTAEPVEVMVWSEGGTANAYEDFEATYVYLLFEPGGPTSQTVSVATMLDGIDEGDETFLMRASRTGGATPAEAVATVTLHDVQLDLPSLSITGSPVHEGDSATVTLTLDSTPATDLFITVWTADGTATGYEDYESLSTDYYWIAGDPLSQTFTIPTVADGVSEGDEAFTVYAGVGLIGATGSPVESSGSVTILDGDSGDPTGDAQTPTITVSDVTVSEGDSATVAVTLSSPPSEPLSLYIGSESITATEGSDYDYVFDFLTFDPAGPLTQTVAVPTFGDNEAEDDETFRIVVTNSQTYELHSGVITISDPNEEESHSCSITDPLPQFTGGEEATTATALVNDSSGASLAVIEGQHIVFSAMPAPWDSVTLSGPGLMETTFRRGEPIVFHVDDDTPVGTPADTVEISVEWTHQCGHIAPTTTFFTVQNVAPTAVDDVEVTSEDDVVYLDRLLLNDTDPSDADSQILSFGEFDIEGVSGGTIRRDSAGRLLYDPGDAFNDLGAGEE